MSVGRPPARPRVCSRQSPTSGVASSPRQFSFKESFGLSRSGMVEEAIHRRTLDDATLMQKDDLVAEAACLTKVVRHHHDLSAGVVNRLDDPLHLGSRARI